MPEHSVRVKNESETPVDDPLVKNQPDPLLLSSGRAGPGKLVLFAIAIVIILGLGVYGFRHAQTPAHPQPTATVNSGTPHG